MAGILNKKVAGYWNRAPINSMLGTRSLQNRTEVHSVRYVYKWWCTFFTFKNCKRWTNIINNNKE